MTRNRFKFTHAGTGKTQMNWFRSLLAGSLAFTAACATGPQTKPSAIPSAPAPAASQQQQQQPAEPRPTSAPISKDAGGTEAFTAALQAYEAGNLDEARKGFEQALAKTPQMINAQFNLGVIAEKQGRADDARVAYEKVLMLDPGHVPSAVNLGLLLRQQGRVEDAVALLEKTLKVPGREHDAFLLNSLSHTYRQAGKLNEAESSARRVLARHKDNPEAYKNLAQVAYARGQYRQAELLAGTALKHSDKDPVLYNLLGMVYLKLEDRARALVQFQKAVSLDEKFTPGHLNAGAIALSYRDYAGAERAFGKAAQLEPGSPEAGLYLAWALDGQKGRDPKKGIAAGEAFEKVLVTRADLPEAVCGAGWAYASDRTGWQKAISFLDRCKGLQGTTDQDKQLITAKVNGLQNMLKAPPPEAPATAEGEGEKKDEATGGGGSMLNQLPQEQGEAEAPPAEGEAPAAEAPSPEGGAAAPAEESAPAAPAAPGTEAPPPAEGTGAGSAATPAPQGEAPAPK